LNFKYLNYLVLYYVNPERGIREELERERERIGIREELERE
jgi:hypothetical protein